jgi:hypothetical protein
MTVRLETGLVEVHCDPGPYAPRKSVRRRRRSSASSPGGGAIRTPAACGARGSPPTGRTRWPARRIWRGGACKGAAVRDATGVARATTIMRDNHYGWFRKVDTGVYALSEAGAEAIHADNA